MKEREKIEKLQNKAVSEVIVTDQPTDKKTPDKTEEKTTPTPGEER